MKGVKPVTTEIRGRGQITIPKKMREMAHMEEGEQVLIIPVGDTLIITPKSLDLDDARRQMRKIMRKTGLSLEKLLAVLEEERASLFEKHYDSKNA